MTRHEQGLSEALLYCPANRPERFAKALAASDQVILDLEDSVTPEGKDTARKNIADQLSRGELPRERVIVRVNAADTAWFEADVRFCRDNDLTTMLPKAEDPGVLRDLTGLRIVAICETPRGVVNAAAIADADTVVALNWGGEGLTSELGGRSSRRADGTYLPLVQYLRPHVLIAAGAAGKPAIDGAYVNLNDTDGLVRETQEGVQMGFASKIALHPKQVPVIIETFGPTHDEVSWARAVLAEAGNHSGAFSFQGSMVDEPLLEQARRFLSRGGSAA